MFARMGLCFREVHPKVINIVVLYVFVMSPRVVKKILFKMYRSSHAEFRCECDLQEACYPHVHAMSITLVVLLFLSVTLFHKYFFQTVLLTSVSYWARLDMDIVSKDLNLMTLSFVP